MAARGLGLFRVAELIDSIIEHVDTPRDLLSCACVNSTWNHFALPRLYRGSTTDKRFVTPHIPWLDILFLASRARFTRNLGYTEHLQIASKKPAEVYGSTTHMANAIACCRFLHREQDAKMLFVAGEKGQLKSLSIPFYLSLNHVEIYKDLMFVSSLRFLLLDVRYCKYLLEKLEEAQQSNESLLPNLIGLTVHLTCISPIKSFWSIVSYLRPKVLSVQGHFSLFKDDSGNGQVGMEAKYVYILCRQTQLQGLSVDVHDESWLAEIIGTMPTEGFETCWPDLKALAIYGEKSDWLKKFLAQRRLKILRLLGSELDFRTFEVESQHLTVIEACVEEFNEEADLFDIVKRFPMLRYVDISLSTPPDNRISEPESLAKLLKALPHIEVLCTDADLYFDESHFSDIRLHCPLLRHLVLSLSRAIISYESLVEAATLPNIVEFDFDRIHIPNALDFMEDPGLQLITDAWQRVFPNLRGIPCSGAGHTDRSGHYDLSQPPEYGVEYETSQKQEVCLLGDSDMQSLSWYLRSRMWNRLGYGDNSRSMEDMRTRWMKEYEESLLGCPLTVIEDYFE